MLWKKPGQIFAMQTGRALAFFEQKKVFFLCTIAGNNPKKISLTA